MRGKRLAGVLVAAVVMVGLWASAAQAQFYIGVGSGYGGYYGSRYGGYGYRPYGYNGGYGYGAPYSVGYP